MHAIHAALIQMIVQVDLTDIESATVLAFQHIVRSPQLMKGVQSRQALKDFADLTASAHPTKLCAAPLCLQHASHGSLQIARAYMPGRRVSETAHA